MIKSFVGGVSSIAIGEAIIRQIRNTAEKYVYGCVDPEELADMTKERLLPLIYSNMKSFAPLFVLGSAAFGLGVSLLAKSFIICRKKSDDNKKEQHSETVA